MGVESNQGKNRPKEADHSGPTRGFSDALAQTAKNFDLYEQQELEKAAERLARLAKRIANQTTKKDNT